LFDFSYCYTLGDGLTAEIWMLGTPLLMMLMFSNILGEGVLT